jgi:hypothetical protein
VSANGFGGALGNNRTNVGRLVEGISQLVVGQNLLHLLDKVIVNLFINIDALDTATALARVEDGTINNFFGSPCQINIGSDVCGVLSTELKSNSGVHSFACSLLYGKTTSNGAGETDELNVGVLDKLLNLLEVTAVEVLNDVLGKASFVKGRNDLFGDCWCLWRRLDDDTVAREKSGDDRVDEGKVWVLETDR